MGLVPLSLVMIMRHVWTIFRFFGVSGKQQRACKIARFMIYSKALCVRLIFLFSVDFLTPCCPFY